MDHTVQGSRATCGVFLGHVPSLFLSNFGRTSFWSWLYYLKTVNSDEKSGDAS